MQSSLIGVSIFSGEIQQSFSILLLLFATRPLNLFFPLYLELRSSLCTNNITANGFKNGLYIYVWNIKQAIYKAALAAAIATLDIYAHER